MQRQYPGAVSLESWEESLQELSECNAGEIGGDEYYELVDELTRIVKSRNDTTEVLCKAGVAIAKMFGKIRGDAEYGIVLERMLDKVYMVPGGHVGLGALLGEIKIEDKANDAHAYLALDAIRVILRYLYLREDILRAARQEILKVCYDTMLRVAVRNGLHNLAEIMDGGAAREEFCGHGSEICRMAMLRNSIYDKRDVPSDEEILRVLRKYPLLSGTLDPKQVIDSKWRLTRLIHYIALDRLVNHEGSGHVYTAVSESNIRVRYWLDKIYRQHGIYNNPEQDLLDVLTQKPVFVHINIMIAIRYLALEIYDFWELYNKNHDLVKDLEIKDPAGIYRIIQECGIIRELREIRNEFGAHPGWAFEKAAERIAAMGLDRFVLNAHLVLMFQDAVCRTMPSRHRRDHVHDVRQAQISVKVDPVTRSEGEKIKESYANTSVVFKDQKRRDLYVTMHESVLCMMLLHESFNEAREHYGKNTLAAIQRFSNEVYNVKYMILEMANFIKQYEEMKLDVTKDGRVFERGFMARKSLYNEFRNNYAAHTRQDGINGIQALIEKQPDILSCVLRDIVEADNLVTRLSSEFPEYEQCSLRLMTSTEISRVQRKLDRIRKESNEHYGNEFVDPDQEQTMQRRKEEVRRILGLE